MQKFKNCSVPLSISEHVSINKDANRLKLSQLEQHTFLFVIKKNPQVLLIITMALFYSSVPVSHDHVTVYQWK